VRDAPQQDEETDQLLDLGAVERGERGVSGGVDLTGVDEARMTLASVGSCPDIAFLPVVNRSTDTQPQVRAVATEVVEFDHPIQGQMLGERGQGVLSAVLMPHPPAQTQR